MKINQWVLILRCWELVNGSCLEWQVIFGGIVIGRFFIDIVSVCVGL